MSASAHDIAHLVALIEAARAQAEHLGVTGVAATLAEAAAEALALGSGSGRPDEGLSPDELTTENDR